MATKLSFSFHKVQHPLGDHKWILDLNQKNVCQNAPSFTSQCFSLQGSTKVYTHTHTHTHIGFVEIHQNYINNPMRVSKIHIVVTKWI